MEAVLLIGIQATGKSSFYKERFADTHVRLNLDMLRTRHREGVLLEACLKAKQPFVVDNTNPTRADRARYVEAAKAAGFEVAGFFFQSRIEEALASNRARTDAERIPDEGVRHAHGRLELPSLDEGFDRLHFVRKKPGGGFIVEAWRDAV